jgi:hypothetical protein
MPALHRKEDRRTDNFAKRRQENFANLHQWVGQWGPHTPPIPKGLAGRLMGARSNYGERSKPPEPI